MTTTFRALVMLAVLVGLPTAWIYYGPLPPEAQRIVDRFVSVARDALGWDRVAAPPAKGRPEIEYVTTTAVKAPPAFPAATAPVYTPAVPVQQVAPPAKPVVTEAKPTSIRENVEPLLQQLRQLGVVEYVLERWGDGSLYRFRCEMPLGAGPDLTQQFEAVTDNPEESVEQVVAQIATWQLARQNERLTR